MAVAMAQASMLPAQTTPPVTGDATPGASGRGVRVIAPDAPAPEPVAPQQYKPAESKVNAVKPAIATTSTAGIRPSPPVLKACDRPIAQPALSFSDPTRLDKSLRSKLRRGQRVALDMPTPYPVSSEAPAPLGAWLNEVKQTGGAVTVSPYCQKGRGFGNFLSKIFGGSPAEPYKAARKYDVTLYVDAVDQVVTQVEFTRRKADQ
ncbi:MAG: hypothetical protein ABW039_11895 [Sphingobium sp.]